MWVNGTAAGQIFNSADDYEQNDIHPDPRTWDPATLPTDAEDTWDSFSLNLGWNHLVFQFDTSVACRYSNSAWADDWGQVYGQEPLQFKFTIAGCNFIQGIYSQSTEPANLNAAPTNPTYSNTITTYNVLGTFAATTPDNKVYVRLDSSQSANLNPNSVTTEAAYPGSAFGTGCPDVAVRGFDMRFGGISLIGTSDLAEGNYVRDGLMDTNGDQCGHWVTDNFTYTAGNNYVTIINGASLLAGTAVCFDGSASPRLWSSPILISSATATAAATGNCSTPWPTRLAARIPFRSRGRA